MPMRIVIAGGAGFIGTNLTRELLDEGHSITCVDNLSTGQISNISQFSGNPKFEFLEHDVILPLPASLRADQIYNLACPASPVFYQRDPLATLRTCVFGTNSLLEFAAAQNARFLQASTSEIYGDPTVHPQSEAYWGNVNVVGVRACYNEGKRCAETLVTDHNRQFGTSVRIARIFNTYGPYMRVDDGRVVPSFIDRALREKDLIINGSGTQTRSFCYIDDLVNGLIKLMNIEDETTGPLNLGNDGETTISELATLVLELTGSRSNCRYAPLPMDDPVRRKPDLTKAKALLGWHPETGIRDGLGQTIQFLK